MALLTETIRQQRMRRVAPWVRGDVLDVGCGLDALVYTRMRERLASYTGIEYTAARVDALRRGFPDLVFCQRDVDEDAFDLPGDFDTVLMLALVEHVYNQKHLWREAAGVLRPGGRVVVTTPTPFGNDVVHRLGARLGLFSAEAAHDHIVIYNRARFKLVARDFGLRLTYYRRFQLGCNQIAVLERQA